MATKEFYKEFYNMGNAIKMALKRNNEDNFDYARKINVINDKNSLLGEIIGLSSKLGVSIIIKSELTEFLTPDTDTENRFLYGRNSFLLGLMSEDDERLLTVAEAAEKFDVSRQTIYNIKEKLTENDVVNGLIKENAIYENLVRSKSRRLRL